MLEGSANDATTTICRGKGDTLNELFQFRASHTGFGESHHFEASKKPHRFGMETPPPHNRCLFAATVVGKIAAG
jgi:hypothetical protein